MKENKENDYFDYNVLKNHVISLVPPHPIAYAITKHQQDKEIASLTETLGNRRFYIVANLETFEIELQGGVEKWLGYSERDFSMKKYLSILQPGNKRILIMIALQLYNSLCKGTMPLNLNKRFSSLVALKHYNGTYLLALKISSPFQYDNQNCLTAHLDQFSIIGKYNGESLIPDFYNITGTSEEERAEQIIEKTKEFFAKIGVFTNKEMEIIKLIAFQKDITQPEIATLSGISINTAKRHSKHILSKAEFFFDKRFKSVSELVEYLKRERLI